MFTILAAALTLAPPALNVHVEGEGYLRFAREGRVVFAKKASLHVVAGHLEGAAGAAILPEIDVPQTGQSLDVDLEGLVYAMIEGKKFPIGQLVLAIFPKTAALTPNGDYLLASDRPTLGSAGEGTNGVIRLDKPVSVDASNKSDKTYKTYPEGLTAHGPQPTTLGPRPKALTPRAATPATSEAAEITLHPDSTVASETFTLGEVADINANPELKARLSAVNLGHAPAIGVTRGLDTAFVMAKIRTAGFKPDHLTITSPEGAHLERASQTITSAQLLEIAKTAVKDQLGFDVPLHLTSNISDTIVPIGQLTLQPGTALKSGSSISLMVDIRIDDKHVTTRNLSMAPNAGTGEGVKAGQIVKIVVRLNGAALECGGRARTAGWVGEIVTVVTDTGTVKSGVVTSGTTVEVKL